MSITDIIDIRGFKVVYNKQVFSAVSLLEKYFPCEKAIWDKGLNELNYIIILVIDTNGNLKTIHDKVCEFKFIPTKEREG